MNVVDERVQAELATSPRLTPPLVLSLAIHMVNALGDHLDHRFGPAPLATEWLRRKS